MDVKELVRKLQLQPHPEGGFYKETYRSDESLTNTHGKIRNVSTAIYFLLADEDKSHFHRIKSDELWFFHQGQALEICFISNQQVTMIILGNEIENGEVPQAVIPANTWFASSVKNGIGYSLVSCTVAPGFSFEDFELADRQDLIGQFPHLEKIIVKYT
jgi:uncharacterized protein